jgi:hypothetical protein
MPPDNEPDLKRAFAELHRRERDSAPPFAAMRERAMNRTAGRQSSAATADRSITPLLWIWGAPAALCMAVAILWWNGRAPAPTPASAQRADSAQHVEQLLTQIEQQFKFDEAISSSSYPTDALLTQTDTDLPPP